MRHIHPVTIQETFVASGVYEWSDALQVQSFREAWSIHQLPDGSQMIRVDIGGWDADENALVEVLCNVPDTPRDIERFDVHQFQGPQRASVSHYVFFAEYVQARTIVDSVSQVDEIPLSSNIVIAPPGLLNLRYIISMAQQEWEGLPNLFPPLHEDTEGVTLETLDTRQIEAAGANHDAQGYRIAYRMKTGRVDTRTIWFDRYQVPLLVEEDRQQARLIEYSRRPEQKS
jgi:hypothetical protein